MIGSPLDIVAAVRVTLVERVLPQLEAATWLAGDVRSSISLLTYLEDALASGAAMTGQGNAAMAAFLDDAAAIPALPQDVRAQMEAAVTQSQAAEPADLGALAAAERALKSALSRFIAARDDAGLGSEALRDRLRDCLREVAACEQSVAQRAGTMTPF